MSDCQISEPESVFTEEQVVLAEIYWVAPSLSDGKMSADF